MLPYNEIMLQALIKSYESGSTGKYLTVNKNPLQLLVDNPKQLRPEVYSKGLVDMLNKALPYINFSCDVHTHLANADLSVDIDIRLFRIVMLIIQEAKIDSCYIETVIVRNGCLITFKNG